MRRHEYNISFESALLRLVSMLDVVVEFVNKIDGTEFAHSYNIYETDPVIFLDELLPHLDRRGLDAIKSAHASLMIPLEGVNCTTKSTGEPLFSCIVTMTLERLSLTWSICRSVLSVSEVSFMSMGMECLCHILA